MPVDSKKRRPYLTGKKQEQRARRQAAGLCTECGEEEPMPGRKFGPRCSAKQKARRS